MSTTTDATVSELAQAGGRPRVDPEDPITALEEHAKQVIEDGRLPSHHRMMALSKAQELSFWIRAGAGRG